jgi:hypothetical protein
VTRRAGFLGRLDARAAVIERMGGRVRPATEAGGNLAA